MQKKLSKETVNMRIYKETHKALQRESDETGIPIARIIHNRVTANTVSK